MGQTLLDALVKAAGYIYISDLRCNTCCREEKSKWLNQIPQDLYSLSQWRSAIKYLYGSCPEISNEEEARHYLCHTSMI